MNKYRNILSLLLFTLAGCVKPFDFDPLSYEKVLVVDATLTDQPGSHLVKLSYTYPLDTSLSVVLPGAEVWIESESGDRIDFAEELPGHYRSSTNAAGVAGESYRLFITTADERHYESSPEALIPSPPIDSIYDQYATLPTVEGDRNVGGIQFFIDSHDFTDQARYFRYEWEDTYKIVTPFPAPYAYDSTAANSLVIREDTIWTCYRSGSSNRLIYGSTVGNSENRMAEFPVRFVTREEQHLRTQYSLLVRQFAISEDAYLFYKTLTENNEGGGSLFDQQTGSVVGNITSMENPEEPVLGFFEVSGLSEKRTFFRHREFDEQLGGISFPYLCLISDDIVISDPDSLNIILNEMYPGSNVYSYSVTPGTPMQYFIQRLVCTDCSWYASTTKPDFWID